jgi:hypothetical protein
VAVLLRAGSEDWQAIAWYSAAHEATVCDVSETLPAAELGAESNGPAVWISSGKHASFLRLERCDGGCSHDSCEQMVAMPTAPLINVGEPGAPLHGAAWIDSDAWLLPGKMQSAFADTTISALLEGNSPPLPPHRTNAQALVTAGDYGLSAVELGADHTDSALVIGQAHAGDALATADRKAKNGVKRAYSAVKGWFRRKKESNN